MYQPHNPFVWIVTFLLGVGLFIVVTLVRRDDPRKIPSWVPLMVGTVAALQIGTAIGLRAYDARQLRKELNAVLPARIAELNLSRKDVQRQITKPDDIARLFSLLKTAAGATGHHSYPTGIVDVRFDLGGEHYHYRVGQDSQRTNEYWVFVIGRANTGSQGMEIGRIHSAEFGLLLDRLLHAQGGEQ